jgi:DNA (cytosine-5)-methyltransferase 1
VFIETPSYNFTAIIKCVNIRTIRPETTEEKMKENNVIKEKRNLLGLTQKDFADALGMGRNGERTLRRWENGESSPSNLELEHILQFASVVPFKNRKRKQDFKFVDLFAGIGGIRIPFQELGGKCVFTSEWDKFAQKTYRLNYGEEPNGDITEIEANEIDDFDVLLAGFPCQPFSQAGLGKGFEDTRGTLFFEIERIISEKRPKAFLLENVKQLKGHDKGRTLQVILQHLHKLDYFVDYEVLRAADYGVPQNRERIYIVGFDTRQINIEENYRFPYPKPTYQKTRLGDILENDVDEKYTISDRLWEGHLRRKREHQEKGNGFGFSLYNAESPYTNTISARYYKDGSEILIDQGEGHNPRKLTPRECARLQGFPENFIIPVSDTQAYKQFGNSVAVPVVRAVAKQLISEMKRLQK